MVNLLQVTALENGGQDLNYGRLTPKSMLYNQGMPNISCKESGRKSSTMRTCYELQTMCKQTSGATCHHNFIHGH